MTKKSIRGSPEQTVLITTYNTKQTPETAYKTSRASDPHGTSHSFKMLSVSAWYTVTVGCSRCFPCARASAVETVSDAQASGATDRMQTPRP